MRTHDATGLLLFFFALLFLDLHAGEVKRSSERDAEEKNPPRQDSNRLARLI